MATKTERMLKKDAQCGEAAKPSMADNLLEEIDSLVTLAVDVSDRVEDVVDVWIGEQPPTEQKAERSIDCIDVIGKIQNHMVAIRKCLESIQNNISRM